MIKRKPKHFRDHPKTTGPRQKTLRSAVAAARFIVAPVAGGKGGSVHGDWRQHAISRNMPFLSLSPELIEEIALYLRARDIATLVLSCRRFHDIVEGSALLRYAYRTELAGVYDSLRNLSRCSIVDRMESLRR